MQAGNLLKIEKKVLGAMLILADSDMNVVATGRQLAQSMGYKEMGGAITFAVQALEMKNYINILGKGKYKVLI